MRMSVDHLQRHFRFYLLRMIRELTLSPEGLPDVGFFAHSSKLSWFYLFVALLGISGDARCVFPEVPGHPAASFLGACNSFVEATPNGSPGLATSSF